MHSDNVVKLCAGAGAMIVWLGLVVWGKTPVEPFVETLKYVAMGVGIYHAAQQGK